MPALGNEYLELDMSWLEDGMDAYMNKQDKRSNRQGELAQDEEKSSMGLEEATPCNERASQVPLVRTKLPKLLVKLLTNLPWIFNFFLCRNLKILILS